MRSLIQLSVVLPAAAEALFEQYLDPAAHAAFTGFPVEIGAEEGAKFHAFDGQLSGVMLTTVRPRLIVQSWRSVNFADDDPDSTLILAFHPAEENREQGQIDLIHLDVPQQDYQGVIDGWDRHYWRPWRTWLESR